MKNRLKITLSKKRLRKNEELMFLKKFSSQYFRITISLNEKLFQKYFEQEGAISENLWINTDLKDPAKWSFINDKLHVIYLELDPVQENKWCIQNINKDVTLTIYITIKKKNERKNRKRKNITLRIGCFFFFFNCEFSFLFLQQSIFISLEKACNDWGSFAKTLQWN